MSIGDIADLLEECPLDKFAKHISLTSTIREVFQVPSGPTLPKTTLFIRLRVPPAIAQDDDETSDFVGQLEQCASPICFS
jgi:hypothetical protein